MAAIVFAIGARPGLTEHRALEVAELLSHRPALAAIRLAGKIRDETRRDFSSGSNADIQLDDDEATVLLALLREPESVRPEEPAFAHLRDELHRHLADGGNGTQ